MASLTLSPSQDSFYGTTFSTGPNGSATDLHCGGFGDQYYSFFQFDFSSVPVGAVISSAIFNVVVSVGSGAVDSPMPLIRRMTHSWVDSTLTLALGGNELGAGVPNYWDKTITDATYSSFTINSGDINSVNITTLVNAWIAGSITNNGMVMVPTAFSGTQHDTTIGSKDNATSSNRPTLVLTYTLPTTTDAPNFGQLSVPIRVFQQRQMST